MAPAREPEPVRATEREPEPATFHYKGFEVPADLARLTGAGPETWEVIGPGHVHQYERYAPISPDDSVLELGCGVGRDAIELTHVLGPHGRYIGVDIIRPSIEWARANIAARFPNFEFHHFDIYSEVHNNVGTHTASDFPLPAESGSVDRVIAQSVFTHMFADDVSYYLGEFRRILKPNGLAFATFFVMDDETRELLAAQATPAPMFPELTFRHEHAPGVWIDNAEYPEGAVSYRRDLLESLVEESGLRPQALYRGYWPGRTGTTDGQDIAILQLAAN
jgi:SAM-dependent methyltransferase